MSRIRYVKGNLRRSDHYRALLTDTSPYEVPIIVSNDGLYKNMTQFGTASDDLQKLISAIISPAGNSIPYRYNISKDSLSLRRLSLLHPKSQIRICEFYSKYDTLICYYCASGKFSIRRPERLGSTFYFRSALSDMNSRKKSSIDTTEIDKIARNPASFFAYSGVDRLYKFYSSEQFNRLKKKFSHMMLLDISKCFSSIYTHSVSWAIKGSAHSKANKQYVSFGSEFDRLMQRMNHDETNGICVGPETSRIFAEIILSAVDSTVQEKARNLDLVLGRDYDCKRYVDDYIIFAKDESSAGCIYELIQDSLAEFNLHLNEHKLQRLERPFVTKKSHVIQTIQGYLADFFVSVLEKKGGVVAPRPIYKPRSLTRGLISTIKSGCYDQDVSYDMVSNYIIASLVKRVERVIDGYEDATTHHGVAKALYVPLLAHLIEIIFFFYTVHSTVASSFNLGRAIIVVWRFLRGNFPDETRSMSGQLHRHVSQLVRQYVPTDGPIRQRKVPVEFLNIILAASEIEDNEYIDEVSFNELLLKDDGIDYFSIVSCLYYVKDKIEYDATRRFLEMKINTLLGDCSGVYHKAHDAHLALDSISCPYLSPEFRRSLLRRVRGAGALPDRSDQELDIGVEEISSRPWFVQWGQLDILNMIQKKELSVVY